MKTHNLVRLLSIVIPTICIIIFTEGLNLGQTTCQFTCSGSSNTISASDQGSNCGDLAGGDCSVAMGAGSETGTDADASVAMGNGVTVNAAYSIGGGDGTQIDDDADRSFVFGEDVEVVKANTFLVGWNGNPTFFATDDATYRQKVSLFTTNYDEYADFRIGSGSIAQDYGDFPDLDGTGQWFYSGDDVDVLGINQYFGLSYHNGVYGAGFGTYDDPATLPFEGDALLTFQDFDATADSLHSSNNLIFAWQHSAGIIEYMRLRADGRLGIGTGTPTELLDVNGNGRFRSVGSGTFANDLSITSNGTLTTSTSDARLKTDLRPLDAMLDKVLQLKAVTFRWKNTDMPGKDIGFIAQDVE